MKNFIKYPFLTLTFSAFLLSCSSDNMQYLSTNCLCDFTSAHSISTDKEDNLVKEYSFTNSPIFGYGVTKEGFARSSALIIKQKMEIDSLSILKIKLVDDNGEGKLNSTSFEFYPSELQKLTPKFLEVTEHVNAFVENIYKKDDKSAFKLVSIAENQQEFNAILNQVRSSLEEGYIDTRIVSYEVTKDGYFVTGGVYTENETLDLFVMQLKDTAETMKIVAFSF